MPANADTMTPQDEKARSTRRVVASRPTKISAPQSAISTLSTTASAVHPATNTTMKKPMKEFHCYLRTWNTRHRDLGASSWLHLLDNRYYLINLLKRLSGDGRPIGLIFNEPLEGPVFNFNKIFDQNVRYKVVK